MNTKTTLERIAAANSVASVEALPSGSWSAADLLARVDERGAPLTDLKAIPTAGLEPESRRWRGPGIAVAVAVAILAFVGVIGFVTISPDAEPTTQPQKDAAGVVEDYRAMFEGGDPYAISLIGDDVRRATDGFDSHLLANSQYAAVTGMVFDRICAATGSTVICDVSVTSGVDPRQIYQLARHTYVVEGGVIVEISYSGAYQSEMEVDLIAAQEYGDWVRINHPDKYKDLILFGQTLIMQNEEIRRLQGQMIAQYKEALGL